MAKDFRHKQMVWCITRPRAFASEAELGGHVQQLLEAEDWECHPESQMHSMGSRADLACICQGKLMFVELKLTLSFEVLSQAMHWLDKGHYVVVAVPKGKHDRMSKRMDFVKDWCASKGIGLWLVGVGIEEVVSPALHRHSHAKAKAAIAEFQSRPKLGPTTAGAQSGEAAYYTPFRQTVRRLEQYVRDHPGCTVKSAIESIQHHYSSNASARGALMALVPKVSDIEIRYEGRTAHLWPLPISRRK